MADQYFSQLGAVYQRVLDSYGQALTDQKQWHEDGSGAPSWGPGQPDWTFLLAANSLYLLVIFVLCRIFYDEDASKLAGIKDEKKKKELEDEIANRPQGKERLEQVRAHVKALLARKQTLKWPLVFYNITCVLAAGYVFVGIVAAKLSREDSAFICSSAGWKNRPKEYSDWLGHLMFVFYAQKFWEYLDTVFFCVRESWRQVSFLHIYHHMSITFVVAISSSFDWNGDIFMPAMLNSFVHVLMYSHYAVAVFGISTPWKAMLTQLQLLQFMIITFQNMYALTFEANCGYIFIPIILIFYMFTMLYLFGQFFIKSYMTKSNKKTQ